MLVDRRDSVIVNCTISTAVLCAGSCEYRIDHKEKEGTRGERRERKREERLGTEKRTILSKKTVISRTQLIWLKISTRDPLAFIEARSLTRNTILLEFSICSPVVYGRPVPICANGVQG